MAGNKKTVQIPTHLIPSTMQVVQQYENRGGSLNYWPVFGKDPLEGHPSLTSLRLKHFYDSFPCFDNIFHEVVNNNISVFRNAVVQFRDISYYYSP